MAFRVALELIYCYTSWLTWARLKHAEPSLPYNIISNNFLIARMASPDLIQHPLPSIPLP